MQNTFHIATFNIHKGLTHFNARFSLHRQREILRKIHADIVFLQEVQDAHLIHSKRYKAWPSRGQAAFLAEMVWPDFTYGKNAVYPAGHHGNAILSKFPIKNTVNQDISAHDSESRGMLHCQLKVEGMDEPIHAICVHLGLLAKWRREQLEVVADYIESHVPPNHPLIVAGDFNDWTQRTARVFASRLQLHEVFESHAGKSARSFPALLPLLRLDRIYIRGFIVKHAEVHSGPQFVTLSDHAILTATLLKK